jgi:hypothetical protein
MVHYTSFLLFNACGISPLHTKPNARGANDPLCVDESLKYMQPRREPTLSKNIRRSTSAENLASVVGEFTNVY